MPTSKSYPHYEINVKDNSIQTVSVEEVLPVHRPVYVLPTQEGPVGDPVWCESATTLRKIFGDETLNMANKKFATRAAFYLNSTLSYNGAFVVRALNEDAKTAYFVLAAKVTNNSDIKQFVTEDDGSLKIDMRATVYVGGVKSTDETVQYGTQYYAKTTETFKIDNVTYEVFEPVVNAQEGDDASTYYVDCEEIENPNYGEYQESTTSKRGLKIEFVEYTVPSKYSSSQEKLHEYLQNLEKSIGGTEAGDPEIVSPVEYTYAPVAASTLVTSGSYYIKNGDEYELATVNNVYTAAGSTFDSTKTYYMVDATNADGYAVVESPVEASVDTYFEKATLFERSIASDAVVSTTKIYPILAFEASNPGVYGNDLGFRFFYKASENDPSTVQYYKTVFNSFSVVRREYNTTTVNVLFDIYGRKYNTFSADPDSIDPESGIKNDMDSVLTNAFDTDNELGTVFPYSIYTYEDQIAKIATQIIETEAAYGTDDESRQKVAESLGFEELGLAYTTADQFAESVAYLKAHPFMINVLTCKNLNGVRYSCAEVVVSEGNDVKLDADVNIMLKHGSDGGFFGNAEDQSVIDPETRDNYLDRYTYQFFKLYLNDRIVDKFRYPFTHIYDIGYSMTTKYALIDFLDIRDDVIVELATQVCMPNKWVLDNGIGSPIKINDNAKDISIGLILRERALLMRESILKGTDCMRCAIYGHAGQPVAATYTEIIPFNFWSAMKHAQYGNTDQMSAQEPRGLPYSYNELFRNWNWINYNENIKEKTWNAGVNYCQYADMTRIFYPALRTVYREETSVLVDQWVVDCLVYTKHECRKAWARFSGRNDRRTNLESAIKEYLEYRLAYLYNGKYDFTVQVYKSIKDIDSTVSDAVDDEVSYVEHVRIRLAFPDTMRVLIFDIEVNRESQGSEE